MKHTIMWGSYSRSPGEMLEIHTEVAEDAEPDINLVPLDMVNQIRLQGTEVSIGIGDVELGLAHDDRDAAEKMLRDLQRERRYAIALARGVR